ncbi:hypothetical protein [Dyadobacter bucti]|uniref:hypothetical protein n=1 Tax=Dyadobacter bucti TaxID=2572203 RepID=UPI003F713421
MLENNFESHFCLKLPTVKNERGAGAICRRVVVNGPRGTIPIYVWPLFWSNLHAGSEIKTRKPLLSSGLALSDLVKQLGDEG